MPKFIIIEEHPDFGSASRRAKALAVRFRERTGIQRSSRGWAVLASSAVLSALVPLGTEQTSNIEYDRSSYDDYYQKEVIDPLIEEFQSYQDGWARSQEDRWFYED